MSQPPPEQPKPAAGPPPTWLAYLRLFRAPNVFTALADIAMGWLFVHTGFAPLGAFAALAAASCLMYTAGMVLNDVYDIEIDRRQRPNRPLPSGAIPLRWAHYLGLELLLVGLAIAWLAGWLDPAAAWPWRAGLIATLLAVCIFAYDRGLKKTPLGPAAMGACRMFNVLLGMSTAGGALEAMNWSAPLGFDAAQWAVAGGLGVYIAGVTWFARREAGASSALQLGGGTAVLLAGLAILASFPWLGRFASGAARVNFPTGSEYLWPLLVAMLGGSIAMRCFAAITDPAPAKVQSAVKQALISIILLDAAVCLAVRHPPAYAIGILLLLVPTLLLGRWIYST